MKMMKFLHFIFFTFFFLFSSHAQDYHPMVVEGTFRSCTQTTVWFDPEDPNESSVEYIPLYYKIEGDTSIEGKDYKKVLEAKYPNTEDFYYYGALREVDKRVYLKPRISWAEEEKVFDFNLEVGDTLFAGVVDLDIEIAVITSEIDSIQLLDNTFRKRWNFTAHQYSVAGGTFVDSIHVFSWMEGIGKTYCLQWGDLICTYSNYPGYHQELLCFYDPDGIQLYSNPEYETCDYNTLLSSQEPKEDSFSPSLSVFPNPLSDYLNIYYQAKAFPANGWFQILNAEGKVIKTFAAPQNDVTQILPVDGWAKGVYFLQYWEGTQLKDSQQFVVQ